MSHRWQTSVFRTACSCVCGNFTVFAVCSRTSLAYLMLTVSIAVLLAVCCYVGRVSEQCKLYILVPLLLNLLWTSNQCWVNSDNE